jgi:hypothetical protein
VPHREDTARERAALAELVEQSVDRLESRGGPGGGSQGPAAGGKEEDEGEGRCEAGAESTGAHVLDGKLSS